jgi:hypothetical protein
VKINTSSTAPSTAISFSTSVDGYYRGFSTIGLAINPMADIFVAWNSDKSSVINLPPNPPFTLTYKATTVYRYQAACPSSGSVSTLTPIETGNQFPHWPTVATDNNGNAIVLWSRASSADFALKQHRLTASRYVKGSGWASGQQIATASPNTPRQSLLAMDGAGNGTVLWSIGDGYTGQLYATRFAPTTGWSPSQQLSSYLPIFYMPVMTKLGDTFALYFDIGRYDLIYRQFAPYVPNQWGWEMTLQDDYAPHSVAVDDMGNAMVVGQEIANRSHQSSRYDAGVGWSVAAAIPPLPGVDTVYGETPLITLAMNNKGGAMALYVGWDNPPMEKRAKYAIFKSGVWTTPTLFPSNFPEYGHYQLAMDDNGNAIAVWNTEEKAGEPGKIMARRYSCIARSVCFWSAAIQLSKDIPNVVTKPGAVAVKMWPDGNAVVVWQQNNEMYLQRYYK